MNLSLLYRVSPYLACLLACTAINLFYFPTTTIFPDEQRILASAIQLAATGEFWVGTGRAWEMPGTALFFAFAVWLFGPDMAITAIRFAQSLLLVVQCALIGYMARRIFDQRLAAFIAMSITALYPFLLFYQGLLLSETLFTTFLVAGMAALYWWCERGLRIDGALVVASLCFAAATLTKATLTILPPLLLAATAWIAGVGMRRTVAILAIASCLYVAFMSPWWIRNAAVLHTFVPFTTSSAYNLYLGNNPRNPDGGIDWTNNAEPEVVARVAELPDELAKQRVYSQAAIEYMTHNPAAVLRASAKKFARFWNPMFNAAEFKTGLYFIVGTLSFGPVLVLALIGAARRWRQWRLLAPLYLVVGYFTFVHIVTIASLRYRLPIEPLLIVLAAEPLAAFVGFIRRRTAGRSQPEQATSS